MAKIICFAFFICSVSLSFSQVSNKEKNIKNLFLFSLVGSSYQSYSLEYDSYLHSNFSVDVFFDYQRKLTKKNSFLTGLEFIDRYNTDLDDSLKIKLHERFIQIPFALGFNLQSENDMMEWNMELGPYINLLQFQKILHPKNYSIPTSLKENHSAFSYFKWGAFVQFKSLFYIKVDKKNSQKLGALIGCRFFVEPEKSSFGKSKDLYYTSSYNGISFMFGTVINY